MIPMVVLARIWRPDPVSGYRAHNKPAANVGSMVVAVARFDPADTDRAVAHSALRLADAAELPHPSGCEVFQPDKSSTYPLLHTLIVYASSSLSLADRNPKADDWCNKVVPLQKALISSSPLCVASCTLHSPSCICPSEVSCEASENRSAQLLLEHSLALRDFAETLCVLSTLRPRAQAIPTEASAIDDFK